MHVEKLVFGFIALLAGLVMYLGFNAKPFAGVESPAKLQETATQVSRSIKEDHWAAMAVEEGRLVEPKFTRAATDSAMPVDFRRFKDIPPQSSGGMMARRGDPTLPAPEELEAKYYYGPIAVYTAKGDPLEALDDAKKLEPPKPKPGTSGGEGKGGGPGRGKGGGMSGMSGMSGSGSMGGSSDSGGYGGSGYGGSGGSGGETALSGKRRMSPGYDLGFRFGMKTFFETTGMVGLSEGMSNLKTDAAPATPKTIVARSAGCVVVTALAPHEEMEAEYRKQFYEVFGYLEGRDTPNYVGFEAQRVEVTDPKKEIAESDWQPLPDVNPTKFKEFIKKLPGSCQEVHLTSWTDPHISMPILPFLLNDFRNYASHSKIPTGAVEDAESTTGQSGGYAGGMGGMGGGYGESGELGSSDGGSMGGGFSGSMGGKGGGSSGYGGGSSGYGGGSEGSMGSKGSGGYSGGGSMGGGGYSGSMGSKSGGSGGYEGGMGSGYGGGIGSAGFALEMPKKLPSTKYKLVRFYDYGVVPGKVYKYRVRLLMYDPNYPEWAAFKPNSSNLTADALTRVHTLENKEPKEVAPANPPVSGMADAVVPTKRTSRRESDWSAPSKPVLAAKPASVYVARKDDEKPECVLVDFDNTRGIYVPKKEQADRGLVLGTHKTKAKEAIEIIHPNTKVIKALKEYRSPNFISKFITVVDLKGLLQLSLANAKDPLKTGAELVSFDPITGQIVVSREFDNFTLFHMFTQPDLPAVGPLGGGLGGGATSESGGYGGGYGGMTGGDSGASGSEGGGRPDAGGGMGMGGKGK